MTAAEVSDYFVRMYAPPEVEIDPQTGEEREPDAPPLRPLHDIRHLSEFLLLMQYKDYPVLFDSTPVLEWRKRRREDFTTLFRAEREARDKAMRERQAEAEALAKMQSVASRREKR